MAEIMSAEDFKGLIPHLTRRQIIHRLHRVRAEIDARLREVDQLVELENVCAEAVGEV